MNDKPRNLSSKNTKEKKKEKTVFSLLLLFSLCNGILKTIPEQQFCSSDCKAKNENADF